MRYMFFLSFVLLTFQSAVIAGNPADSVCSQALRVGFRFQHSLNLYTENGFSAETTLPSVLHGRLGIGFTYVTSRFGTALNTNALKQDNFMLSGGWYFRPDRKLQPFTRFNAGWFHADYEYAIFDDLQNNALLLSVEPGILYNRVGGYPFDMAVSFGYNILTGNGITGVGTVYPLFYQFSIFYRIK